MRLFSSIYALLALAVVLFAAGCERVDNQAYTAEIDEPGYRRGKELLRQGRNQEALSEFDKVLAKRGLNSAPESHLELALIYQQHIKDPIAAIYHFQKYRDLKPNSEQTDLVRQRIEAAKREFARTLPGRPSIDAATTPSDYADVVRRLQNEIEGLRASLRQARVAAGVVDSGPVGSGDIVTAVTPVRDPNQGMGIGMPTRTTTNLPAGPAVAQQQQPTTLQPPVTQQLQPTQPQRPTQTQQTNTATTGRRHTVKQGESLYGIARQYYGSANNAQVDGIVNANRGVINSRNDPLRVGMELRIP